MPKTVVVTVPGMISSGDLEPLKQVSEVEYLERDSVTEEELAELCQGADFLMLNYDVIHSLSPEFYARPEVQSLSGVSADITGMDWASPEAAREQGIPLYNIPHYSSQSVAESILSEILLHSRKRHLAYIDLLDGREPEARQGINLKGRTAGVVGLGSIGQTLAPMLQGLGMKVIAWSPSSHDLPGVEEVSLEQLFDEAQVVCICMKTVKEGPQSNVGIISKDLLYRCSGTIVVNLANGGLVDHQAMKEAIASEKVSGYSIELTQAPEGIRKMEAVHLPPANAWSSEESLNALRATWVANTVAAIQGKPQNRFV